MRLLPDNETIGYAEAAPDNKTTSQRDNGYARQQDNKTTSQRVNETTRQQDNETTSGAVAVL